MLCPMPLDPEYLAAAVEAARRGERSGFEALYRVFNPPLVRFLRQQLPWVADDLAADTWLDAARGLTSFEGDGDDFRRWLFTIARRRMVDHFRREGRRVSTTPLTGHDDPGGSDGAAGEALAGLAAQDAIAALVRDLPESQAEVVLLRVVADLSVEDVAQLTGRSPGAVRVLQHRALRRLATLWDPSRSQC
jgi:RNA polymerase sigma-70 factor (ECF subfamily)